MNKNRKSKAAGTLFTLARVIVGAVALLLLVFGCLAVRATLSGEIAWWCWPLAVFMIAGGLWFGWSAVRPHRENVRNMSAEIVARILAELF